MSCPFSRFAERVRDAAGLPGTGIHRFHIGPVAVFDFLLTVIAVYIIWRYFSTSRSLCNYLLWFLVAWCFATVVHITFGIETGVVKLLKQYGIVNDADT